MMEVTAPNGETLEAVELEEMEIKQIIMQLI
jgi:hypothetical protein